MNKKLLASFKARNEKGRVRQMQAIGYLSLTLNVVLLLVLAWVMKS